MTHSKEKADSILRALLGSDELVTRWWKSANWSFNLQNPEDVWQSDPQSVYDYLLFYASK